MKLGHNCAGGDSSSSPDPCLLAMSTEAIQRAFDLLTKESFRDARRSVGGALNVVMSEIIPIKDLGMGAFGAVQLAKYQGTLVAVKSISLLNQATLQKYNPTNSPLLQSLFTCPLPSALPSSPLPSADHQIRVQRRHLVNRSASQLRDFFGEIEILKSLRHPNIVQLIGAAIDSSTGNAKLLLEYCPRGSLWEVLHSNKSNSNEGGGGNARLGWVRRAQYAIGIARALVYLHEMKPYPIIHRDVKTLNILVVDDSNVKLADFGWARVMSNLTHNNPHQQHPSPRSSTFNHNDKVHTPNRRSQPAVAAPGSGRLGSSRLNQQRDSPLCSPFVPATGHSELMGDEDETEVTEGLTEGLITPPHPMQLNNNNQQQQQQAQKNSAPVVYSAKVGTYQWMAPEVYLNKPYGPASDIFSLGVVLWEILTREPPYKGVPAEEVARRVALEGMRPPIPQKCPRAWMDLMTRCWNADETKRPTARAALEELEVILGHAEESQEIRRRQEVDQLWVMHQQQQQQQMMMQGGGGQFH